MFSKVAHKIGSKYLNNNIQNILIILKQIYKSVLYITTYNLQPQHHQYKPSCAAFLHLNSFKTRGACP